VLPQLHGMAPTVQERKSQHFISTNKIALNLMDTK
jgi:hypothetical protein